MPKLPDSWGNLRLGFDLLFWDNLVSTWDILQLILTNFRGDSQVQPSYSTAYLFFLLNNAHCAFQELDHRRLVLFRMLPQVLHVRWPRKSGLKVVNIKKNIGWVTLLLKIWLPPFCAFEALHFPSTFAEDSSRSWSRGTAPPPPCAAGSGPGRSCQTKHPDQGMLDAIAMMNDAKYLDDAEFKLFALHSPDEVWPTWSTKENLLSLSHKLILFHTSSFAFIQVDSLSYKLICFQTL